MIERVLIAAFGEGADCGIIGGREKVADGDVKNLAGLPGVTVGPPLDRATDCHFGPIKQEVALAGIDAERALGDQLPRDFRHAAAHFNERLAWSKGR